MPINWKSGFNDLVGVWNNSEKYQAQVRRWDTAHGIFSMPPGVFGPPPPSNASRAARFTSKALHHPRATWGGIVGVSSGGMLWHHHRAVAQQMASQSSNSNYYGY